MATRPYRRSHISVLRQDGDTRDQPGAQAIRAAFNNKDIQALEEVLKQHPNAWTTHLARLDHSLNIRHEGACAVMAIHLGWVAALPVLHAAGDPLTGEHPRSGRTVLQLAVYKGQIAAVKKLLKLGVPLGESEGKPALAGLLGSGGVVKKAKQAADALLAAGANPWIAAGNELLPLPVALLHWENVALAAHLAQHGTAPLVPDDGSLLAVWKKSFKRHDASDHIALLDALHSQGMAPSVMELSRLLPEASRTASMYHSSNTSEADVIVRLVERRIHLGTTAQEMREARPFLDGDELAKPVLALVEQMMLDDEVPGAASPRRALRF